MATPIIKFIIIILAIFTPYYGNANPVVTDPISLHLPVAENLKSYALAACIGYGFPEAALVQKETRLATQAYFEAGRVGIDAYNDVAALARTFIAKNYLSEQGEKWTIIKCVDLINSKELAGVIRKHTPSRSGKNPK